MRVKGLHAASSTTQYLLLSMLLLYSVMLTHMFVLHQYCAFQAATARPTVRRTAAPRRTARPTARRTALPTAAATTAATAAATATVTTVAPSVAPTTAANDTATNTTTTTEFYTLPLTTQFVGQASAAVDSIQQAAFSAAVLAVAGAANKGLNPAATDPAVTILSVTESSSPATRRHLRGQPLHSRQLQAAADAVVSYEVQRLSGQAAATAVGQQLAAVSTDGSLLAAFKAQAAQRGVPTGAITATSLITTPGYVATAYTVSLLSVNRTVHRYACSGSVARPSHSTVISATHKDFETSFTQQNVLICDVSYMRNTATALPLIHKHYRNLRQEPVPPAPKKKSTPTGLIVGVVVGCAVLIGLFVAAALLCYRRKNKRKHAAAAQQQQQQQQLLKAKDMSVGHSGVSTSSTTSRAPVSAVGGKRGATAVVPDIEHGGIIKNSSSLSTGTVSYGNGGHGNGIDYDSHDEGTDAGTTAAAITAAAAATAVPAAVAISDYSKEDLLLMQQQQQHFQNVPITATPLTAMAADVPMSDYSREEYLLAQHEQQQQQQQQQQQPPMIQRASSISSSGSGGAAAAITPIAAAPLQAGFQRSRSPSRSSGNSLTAPPMSDYSKEDLLLMIQQEKQQQQQQQRMPISGSSGSGVEQEHKEGSGDVFTVNNNSSNNNKLHMSEYSCEDYLLQQQQQQQRGVNTAAVAASGTEQPMSDYSKEDLLLLQQQQQQQQQLQSVADIQSITTEPFMSDYSQEDLLLLQQQQQQQQQQPQRAVSNAVKTSTAPTYSPNSSGTSSSAAAAAAAAAAATSGAAHSPLGISLAEVSAPWALVVYNMCEELIQLFGAAALISSNCAELVRFAAVMQVRLSLCAAAFTVFLTLCSCMCMSSAGVAVMTQYLSYTLFELVLAML
jgi:hypothetical protein